MSPYPPMPRTTTKIPSDAAPDSQSTRLPDTVLEPPAKRIRWRPNTHPSIMIASHGTTGYLMLRASLPYVAIVNAAATDELPGGCQNQDVGISPSAIHPTASATSPELGSRRSGA